MSGSRSRQLTTAGLTILGGLAYGAQGAALGWSIGQYRANRKTSIEQSSIADLRLQTSDYGIMIPFVGGTQRLAGNIIWTTDKVPHEKKQRTGKGGWSSAETTVVTYSVSMAIAICAGPITGITRIWMDETLKMDVNGGQSRMPNGTTLYLGTDSQLPSPVIEAHEGVGNVPAYRGISYIVFEDFDLGASGRIPMFSFEVTKGSFI